jgi:beta-N-acetylhexosaminidase
MPRSARFRTIGLLALTAALLVAACASPPTIVPTASPGGASGSPSASPSPTVPAADACAVEVLNGMNEGERVGQLFLLGLASDELGEAERDVILTDHVGSVWFTEKSQVGAAAIRSVADAVQALTAGQAQGSGDSGVGLFIAANQEGGLVQALNGPGFSRIPSALVQGSIAPATLQADARTWGTQLKKAGINLDFAPVTDVVPPGTDRTNAPIGALDREYGHSPTAVATHAAAFVKGMAAAGIPTVAKHFPGLGRVTGNTDDVAGVVDRQTTASDPYLAAFRTVIGTPVPFVMVALATYTKIDTKALAAFSPIVIGNLLRQKLGFSGIVMSDDLGATAAVQGIPPATRAIDFVSAGGEMIISKTVDPTVEMAVALTAKASSDPDFRTLVNAAALHVLEMKDQAHLLTCGNP